MSRKRIRARKSRLVEARAGGGTVLFLHKIKEVLPFPSLLLPVEKEEGLLPDREVKEKKRGNKNCSEGVRWGRVLFPLS